ncbi:urea transporter [Paraburkholderia acidipaludis]|uniref:urea transporter n=1 Tax=Paraburkholderia acidipaludis TaxID=660537 RepID=UPI000A012A68|nr:urea transporter [Paraburkholderia acidipaludis]
MSIRAQAHGESAALRTLLRSVGQIVLQRHAGTGACLLAALALCDLRLACAALIGATTANVCAVLAGHPDAAIRDGLAGFNGALAGLAACSLIGDAATAIAAALLAAAAAGWLGAPLGRRLARAGLSVYSTPCLVATWAWLALRAGAPSAPPAPVHAFATLFAADGAVPHSTGLALRALGGVLSGVAQSEFASGAPAGLLVLAGIALSSRRAAGFALAGAALASAVELACGAAPADFDAGLAGFNGALAALATLTLGTRAAFCATMFAAVLHLAAVRCGLPAMTAPFVLASWCAHGTARALNRKDGAGGAARPAAPATQDAGPTSAHDNDATRAAPSVAR